MKQGLVPVAAVALLLLGAWPGSSAAGRSDWLFPTGPGISTMGEGLGPEPKGDPRIASRVMQAARASPRQKARLCLRRQRPIRFRQLP